MYNKYFSQTSEQHPQWCSSQQTWTRKRERVKQTISEKERQRGRRNTEESFLKFSGLDRYAQ
jgi:hypothetical protein